MGNKPSLLLSGLSVLVPRPNNQGDTFSDALEKQGCKVHRLPVMVIRRYSSGDPSIVKLINSLPAYDFIIVVSRTAAEIAVGLCHKINIKALFIAVGASSAKILDGGGFDVSFPHQHPTSEGLLGLSELQDVAKKKILILRGRGGRNTLRDTLEQRGAEITYGNLYQRELDCSMQQEIETLLLSNSVQATVIHSAEIFQCLIKVLKEPALTLLKALPIIVPGERVALIVQKSGCQQIVVASNALPENMVDAVDGWYTSEQQGRHGVTE